LVAVAKSIPDSAVRDRIKEFVPLKFHSSDVASRFGASGYVVDTVPLALYCPQFIAEKPLSIVIAQAIEAGGDTDTIASITEETAGTFAGVPPDYAEQFSRIIGGNESSNHPSCRRFPGISEHTLEATGCSPDFLQTRRDRLPVPEERW
jgi:ADP-ribosylglycohydrolase